MAGLVAADGAARELWERWTRREHGLAAGSAEWPTDAPRWQDLHPDVREVWMTDLAAAIDAAHIAVREHEQAALYEYPSKATVARVVQDVVGRWCGVGVAVDPDAYRLSVYLHARWWRRRRRAEALTAATVALADRLPVGMALDVRWSR